MCISAGRCCKRTACSCHAISNHLVGQAVCDLIDERHSAILPPEVWGDGEPEGVRQRAAAQMIDTASAARAFFDARPGAAAIDFPAVVNGFTGSSIWHAIYAFPPTSQDYWQQGFADFAQRWRPILDAFDKVNVNFALEVHPTEIAFDIASAQRATRSGRPATRASASTTIRRISATRASTT